MRITVEGGEPEAEAWFTVDDIARRTMEKAPAGGMMDFDAVPAYRGSGEWREGFDLKAHGWVGRGAARFETRPGSSVRILALTSDEIVDAFREAYRRRRELRGGSGPQVEAKPGRFFAVVTDGLSARGLEKPVDPRPEPKPRLVILRVDRYETYDGVQHILYRWWHEKAERFIAEGDDPHEPAWGADEKKAPGTVAELAEREAPDDYDALLKLAAEDNETKGFYALLKLRDRGDQRAVPVLGKVLAREFPGTRIHGFAAAQALFCIGTAEAHQLLARYLNTPQYHANLAVDYAFHWDMAPAKRDAFIERYHLTSTSKDLTVSLGAERQGTGEIVFTFAVRNVSNKPFRVHKPGDYVGKLLVLRAAGGQFVNRWEIVRLHAAQLTFDQMYPTLDPGASYTWRIVTRPRWESDEVWHSMMRAPKGLLLASQDVAHFVGKPGKFQAYVLFDVAPLTKQQLGYHKVADPGRVWSGRVVSNPVEITIPAVE